MLQATSDEALFSLKSTPNFPNCLILSPLTRHRGFPTGANVVHPVGRAEASVARLFSRAVQTFASRLPNANG